MEHEVEYIVLSFATPCSRVFKRKLLLSLLLLFFSSLLLTYQFVLGADGSRDAQADSQIVAAPQPEYIRLRQQRQLVRSLLYRNARFMEPAAIERLSGRVVVWASEAGFDPLFVLALIKAESGFRPDAISYAGAVGLMQLLPYVAEGEARAMGYASLAELGDGRETDTVKLLCNPEVNIRVGIHYLARLRERFSQDEIFLAAYNMGPTLLSTKMSTGFVPAGHYADLVRSAYTQMLVQRGDFMNRLDRQIALARSSGGTHLDRTSIASLRAALVR